MLQQEEMPTASLHGATETQPLQPDLDLEGSRGSGRSTQMDSDDSGRPAFLLRAQEGSKGYLR